MKKKIILMLGSTFSLNTVTMLSQDLNKVITELQKKYRGDINIEQFKRGAKLENDLQRQRALFPGRGFIDPEHNLGTSQKKDLFYYRNWKRAV